ncbi:alpha/beta hydrolase [Halolamina litorea]|uniref:Alpha/beta fold hydrolase n=1 Tax=Halolamina litorea TaxID=1515593 RepID=A0ABD6BUU1_9EURY|nr:alpha/beta fold hydrolase [Halolamina litorea]
MEAFESARVERLVVDGTGVRCFVAGEGPPLVLLHGGGLDSATLSWRELFPLLSDRFTVYAPDWPGYGASDDPTDSPTTAYYCHMLADLIDELDLDAPALAGVSMGGGAALGYALGHPERVSRLVLIDSYGLGGRVPGGSLGYYFTRLPYVAELTWGMLRRSRWLVALSLRAIVGDADAVTERLVDEAVAAIQRPGAGRTFRRFQRAEVGPNGLRTNYVDRLPDLSVPTLVIHGEADPLVPVEWAVRAGTLMPDAEVRILPDCGHWPPRERPEDVVSLIGEFLE